MTHEEAKFILGAFRPSGRDADSPPFGDALRMAGTDPILGHWLERSRAFDSAIASKLGQVAPPPRLREDILAGARVSAGPRSTVVRLSWVAGLAAAAALAFVVATMKSPVRQESLVPAFGGFAINDTVNGGPHGGRGESAAALVSGLQESGAPIPGAGQIDFERLRDSGCRTLSFAGHDVLEVCFARNGAMFHLYVVRHDASFEELVSRGPAFIERAGAAAAVWSDRNLDFALVTRAGANALRKLL